VQGVIVEDVAAEEDVEGELAGIVVSVRLRRGQARRCGVCRRRRPGYDQGTGRRRWRALDLGTVPAFLEAEAPRVSCPEHGVVVAAVPWARHGAGHTRAFDDTATWLATRTSKSALVALLRVTWRTMGGIVQRVGADAIAAGDRFANLARIGIDEISYKRGHRYLIVGVDHDSGRLVWAAPGRDEASLRRCFDLLGEERSAAITLVSADAAEWIAKVVRERCPGATLCLDPFHVVTWATDALDEVRREVWNAARRGGQGALAKELK
jgi:transposase